MGRELKRVPMDFKAPLHDVWPGYLCNCECVGCRDGEECEVGWQPTEPPVGDGYQLWETTSEGSPDSPVFATLEALCEYAAEHCTTFGSFKATAEEWRKKLDSGIVGHEETMPNGVRAFFC